MPKSRKIIGHLPSGMPIYEMRGGGPQDPAALLKVVDALDPEKRQKEEPAPSDTELKEAREGLALALREAVAGDDPDIDSARAIRAAIDRIDSELVTRDEARASVREEAKKLLDGLNAEPPAGDLNDDPPADPPADDPPADPDDKEKARQQAIAAAANLADALTRTKRRTLERVVEAEPRDVIVASVGPAQGMQLGADATLQDAAKLFTTYAPHVKRGSAVLLHMEKMYPPERSLGLSAEENTRIIEDVMGPRAIAAAGGICEPLPADFTHPICGDRGRPIRDGLPGFRADRGGARFAPSATVADLEPAITVWTAATDAEPGSATKDCPRVDCEVEDSFTVDAIVACLTVGNFQARFNPEFWRSRLDLLMVAHDRIAEQTLYATIETGSTQVSYAGGSGTVVDVLQAIDKAVAGLRSRHRLIGTRFRTILPAWLRDALRAHLVHQAPSGTLDTVAVADAQLANFFTTRMVDPIWSPDVEVFGAQGAGTLLDFPGGDVDVVIFPEGTWLFGDGGTLDLGTAITDSTLNAVNDRQAFLETFEQVFQRGCESLSIDVPVSELCICSEGILS